MMRGIVMLALAAGLSVGVARAATIEVDARSPEGSGKHRRISDAVAAAAPGDTIHVTPGVYSSEDVPIVVGPDKRGLTISGSTVLEHDAAGLPTGADPSSAAMVTGGRSGQQWSALIYVTGEDVTIRGLVLDGQTWMIGILVDGNLAPGGAIARFDIAGNWFRSSAICLFTRGASGTIEGNLIGKVSDALRRDSIGFGGHFGAIVAGGRFTEADSPETEVVVTRNRVAGNSFGGVYCIADRATALPPAEDPAAHAPGALSVLVANNDFSRNGDAGLHFVAHGNQWNSQADHPSLLVGTVCENTFRENFHHGFAIHAPAGSFAPQLCAGAAPGEVRATLADNVWERNGANDAMFGFTSYNRSVNGLPACYVTDNQITVEGEVPAFDYDAPVCDPDADGCVPLGNTLLVNDSEVTGRSITPRK